MSIFRVCCVLFLGIMAGTGGCGAETGAGEAKANLMDDCPPEQSAAAMAPEAVTAQAGVVSGRVMMESGAKVVAAGARMTVSFSGITEAGEAVSFNAAVAADGTYRQSVAPGSYAFDEATIDVAYQNKKYTFALEPVGDQHDQRRDSSQGIVQDFVWKLTGPTLTSAGDVNDPAQWHGGSIGVQYGAYRNDKNRSSPVLDDGLPITFVLTPTVATIVDGSQARAITIERKYDARLQRCDAVHHVPAGHYELSGHAIVNGERRPLLFELSHGKYSHTQAIIFVPDPATRGLVKPLVTWVIE